MPKISVITVNYNHKVGLDRTVASVFCQDYPDLEYIVIDGGSSDGSDAFLADLADKADLKHVFKYVSEPDKGTYDAMNKGLAMATGDYVLFLNSGDVLASPHVLKEVFALPQTADLIVGRQYQLRNGKKQKAHRIATKEVNKEFLISNTLPHQATFIKRDLLLNLGGYDLNYRIVADWVFWYQAVVCQHASVSCIPTFVSVMEEEGISKDISLCRQDMARFLHSQCPVSSESEWLERIEDNASAYLYQRATQTRLGRLLTKIAIRLSK